MSTITEKMQNAGKAARDAAEKTGEKMKKGADTAAEKIAEATKKTGEAMKRAGQKVKEKSGA
jgi:hypothetical protein